ncbi:hypothetical protein K439DRAFT_1615893 [Ramaria rubella]|nr:hypothetical protein K439DRAFT_1615893 [Ramaria rubella]
MPPRKGPLRCLDPVVRQPTRQSAHVCGSGSRDYDSTVDSDDSTFHPVASNRSGSTETTPDLSSGEEMADGGIVLNPDLPPGIGLPILAAPEMLVPVADLPSVSVENLEIVDFPIPVTPLREKSPLEGYRSTTKLKQPDCVLGSSVAGILLAIPNAVQRKFSSNGGATMDSKTQSDSWTFDNMNGSFMVVSKPLPSEGEPNLSFTEWHQAWQ